MSIKNIVNAQVAKVTQYNPTTGLVDGLATDGNITANAGAFFIGDGGLLSNISVPSGASIANGNSTVNIAAADGNVTMTVAGEEVFELAGNSVSLGYQSGSMGPGSQGIDTVAIGMRAGQLDQSTGAIAIGNGAGQDTQLANSIAIGSGAGYNLQSTEAIAIGTSAGAGDPAAFPPLPRNAQGTQAIAIGSSAGVNYQGANSVAIGTQAGANRIGNNSVAVGAFAGAGQQAANSIVINATGANLDATNSGLYAAPVRNDTGNTTNVVYYNTTTKEVTYGPGVASYGNSNVAAYLPGYTGNLDSADSVTATGNITAANLISSGTNGISISGNLIASSGNITIDPLDDGTSAGNVVVLGNMSVTGTLSYNNLSNTTTSNLTWIAAYDAVSNSAATGGGLQVGLDNGVYATWLYDQPSNVWSASLGVSAPYFTGDGANLTNVTVSPGSYIANGTSSVAVADVDGNVVFGVNGASYGQLGTANTVMIGYESGAAGTAEGAVALGKFAGYTVGNANVTAVGTLAGSLNARANSVSIGVGAGWGNMISGGGTGLNSIAIGSFAARNGSANNTIILNATGANFDGVASQANSFYVNPVRNDTGNTTNVVYYNTTTKEVTYGPASGGSYGDSNVTSLLASFGSNTISTTGNITAGNFELTGNITKGTGYSIQLNPTNFTVGINQAAVVAINPDEDTGYVALGTVVLGGGAQTIAIGPSAQSQAGGAGSISIGYKAAPFSPGAKSIAIGQFAGFGAFIGTKLGANAIAIGYGAANGGSAANVIVLNATGANFTPSTSQASSFYVNPVRNDTGNVTNAVYYNTSTKEITYGPTSSAFSGFQAPFSGALTAANMGQWIQANGNITLPDYTTVPTGGVITITNSASGGTTAAKVTVFNQTNDFIYYPPTYTSTNRSIQLFFGQWIQLMSRGTGEWDVIATNIGNAQKIFAGVAQNAEFSMDLMNFRYTGSRLQFSPVSGSFTVYGQTLTLEPGSGPRSDSFNSATYTAGTWTDLTGVNITIAGSTAEAFLTALNGTYVRQYRVTCMVDSTNLAYITIERLYNTTL